MTTSGTDSNPWLRRFSKGTCLATLILIFIGAMVKSTGSGLAVPDWPLSYGMLFPPMVGGVFYEHGHRMAAATVGFLMLCLAIWLRIREPRRWVRHLGFWSLGAVVAQGILGGLTVLFFLPTWISVFHGMLAQTFFVLTIVIAYSLSVERRERMQGAADTRHPGGFVRLAAVWIGLVVLQLFLGALMRHTESGLAIPDFPTMGGTWIPSFDTTMLAGINDWRFEHNLDPVSQAQVIIHFLHRLGALVLAAVFCILNWQGFRKYRDHKTVGTTLLWLNALVVAQIFLGAMTVLTMKAPRLTSLHVATGAAILGVSVLLLLRAAPLSWRSFLVSLRAPLSLSLRAKRSNLNKGLLRRHCVPPRNDNKLSAYAELTKPRILMLVLVTTTLGFYLGGEGIPSWIRLGYLLLGVALVSGGSSALNHYLEREFDAKMLRTKNRPIPAGVIAPGHALNFGVGLVLLGIFVLYITVHILTAFLALLTSFLYIMVYTPMKRVSWWNTTIGAVPGAIPPLGGWAAATGGLDFHAGILFLILFLWQHPHFYAIAWMLRDDYRRGGFQMLPVVEPDGRRMFEHILIFSRILIPVSLVPAVFGASGAVYFTGALIAGVALLRVSHTFATSRSIIDARRLLRATVVYLPILLVLIVMDVSF